MQNIGVMELAARLIGKQHGWAGHVTRLSAQHVSQNWASTGTLEDWHLKQAIYSHFDRSDKTSWRHKRKGKQTHWETNLASVFGDLWRVQANDRKLWRSSRLLFVHRLFDALLGNNSKPLGVKPLISAVDLGTIS